MTLYDLEPGQNAEVTAIHAQGAIRQRLFDMGILPTVHVEMERRAPVGEPVWIKLLGTQVALRRHEAQEVHVVQK